MSDFTDAFADLYEAQTESCGVSRTITIGAVTASAIVSPLTTDEVIVAGGIGDNGGYSAQVLVSDFATRPAKNATVTFGASTLYVLQISESNGIYTLTMGDPA